MIARMPWIKAKQPVESTPFSQTIYHHFKSTVTWRLMVVGGQCSSAEWMGLFMHFYRFWKQYQQGFGNLSGEFWLGLDKIHRLTSTATQLRVDLKDFDGNSRYALYSSFSVGDSASKYILLVSGYTGTAGDSHGSESKRHNGHCFSTKDRDNDVWEGSCAQTYQGGWWYDWCHASNLNGLYLNGRHMSYADGVNWHAWKGYHYSLKFTEMKLKQYWLRSDCYSHVYTSNQCVCPFVSLFWPVWYENDFNVQWNQYFISTYILDRGKEGLDSLISLYFQLVCIRPRLLGW